jgi:hypothetical protein
VRVNRKPEVFQSSVVCIGAFNPPIVTPEWLNRHKLIGDDDADRARKNLSLLITPQVAQFESLWFGVQILENQFTVNSKGVVTHAFRDLAAGILSLLPQTPITAMGMNFMAHYKLASIAEYHQFGDALAPKSVWKNLVKKDGHQAGLATLTMQIREMSREKMSVANQDVVSITAQPSTQFPHGIFLMYNDHRVLSNKDDDEKMPAERAAELLDSDWECVQDEAKKAFGVLIQDALGETENG